MREFWRRLNAVKRLTWEVLIVTLVINVLALTSSLYSIQVLNRYVALGIDSTLLTLTVGALIALVMEWMARSARFGVLQWLCSRADAQLADAAYTAISKIRYSALLATPAETRNESLRSLHNVQATYSAQNLASVIDAPFSVVFLSLLFLLSPTVGWAVIIVMALVLVSAITVYARVEQPSKDMSQASVKWSAVQSVLANHPEMVRAFNASKTFYQNWSSHLFGLLKHRQAMGEVQNRGAGITQSATTLMTIVVYAVGAREVVAGRLDVGSLIGINIFASRALASVTRVVNLVEPVKRGERSLEMLGQLAKLYQPKEKGLSLSQWFGNLRFDDLAFAYPKQPAPILESFNLAIEKGQVAVFTGDNGAGKTTLAKMITGLVDPTRGRIRIDGLDLRQVDEAWWPSQMMYVPQEPCFFDGSIRDNLMLDRVLEDDELLEICNKVGLQRFLANTTDGLNTAIQNGGAQLPVGIRRRLALARALVVDGQLVVLDEPTEGLDAEGCQSVATVLNELVKQQKTIMVMSNDAFIVRAANVRIDLNQKPVPAILQAAPAKEGESMAGPKAVGQGGAK
ncbi:MAG: ATP-binding cassette domain-containing protein [Gammaproteobacteria bacterium]|nr:ATP-binding cassette domain-containing protein [Gammaproteobacteria bacterium]